MSRALVISVRFHDGRYHGARDWPPSPARLFQALVAGAACGKALSERDQESLEWLESLDPPMIAAPAARDGRGFKTFVPNNDRDVVEATRLRGTYESEAKYQEAVAKQRVGKAIRPRHFDAATPLLYAWTFNAGADAERHARVACEIADRLYQLGRCIDMAWAQGEVLAEHDAEARLCSHGGAVRRPCTGGTGTILTCPVPSSLASLMTRHALSRERFKTIGNGKKARQLFSQAPKAEFASVSYDSASSFHLFDIRNADAQAAFASQRLDRAIALTEKLRDAAADRLKRGLPGRESEIDRVFIGRDATEADKSQRIRIMPLPSIGHTHTERSIRRVLVERPPDCPIAEGDIEWAFSGHPIDFDEATGEIPQGGAMLVTAQDRSMLDHYGIEPKQLARWWRTVTPAALPERTARRRIDHGRIREEAKGGAERLREYSAAEGAVRQALRHAGINASAHVVRVQREPFEARGQRAESFATGTRFAKERLWHVEIEFAEPVVGPLVIGDGRYLGLGLMAPVRRVQGIFAFAIVDGLDEQANHNALTRALRRAVMARVQDQLEPRAKLSTFFTGHEAEGAPARSGRHGHLAFAFDPLGRRLMILAPHMLERSVASGDERKALVDLEAALDGFCDLRAGAAGRLALLPCHVDTPDDPFFAPSRAWESVTPYRVTRHAKLDDAAGALKADLVAECLRGGLPRPAIEVHETFGKSGLGLFGRARLIFCTAVRGPMLLGRDRHFGGGLFVRAD